MISRQQLIILGSDDDKLSIAAFKQSIRPRELLQSHDITINQMIISD